MAAPLMLLTVVAIALSLVVVVIASFAKNYFFVKVIAGAAVSVVLVYFGFLLVSSLNSKEKVLALNEPKPFCGFYLDCHMHLAVTSVTKTKTISGTGGTRTANGNFYIVTVKVFNDARRATIGLLAPHAFVTDQSGKPYGRVEEAEQLLPASAAAFDQLLAPDGSFTKPLVFDLPEGTANPTMQVNEGYRIDRWLELFLVGDEDSLLHKKTRFQLEGIASN